MLYMPGQQFTFIKETMKLMKQRARLYAAWVSHDSKIHLVKQCKYVVMKITGTTYINSYVESFLQYLPLMN